MENVQSSLALASQLVESGQVKVTALLRPLLASNAMTKVDTLSFHIGSISGVYIIG